MRMLMLLGVCLVTPSALMAAPNVLLVITDDQGYGDLGYHQNPIVKTPHLDRFAKANTQLTQFYVSPVCSPTRSALMTGRYNYRTGAVDTFIGRSMMFGDEVTLAERFGQAGYRTGLFGKWHLGDNYPMRPQDQGFQEVLMHRGGGIGQPADPPNNHYSDPQLVHNGQTKRYPGYCSDIFTDAAMQFMKPDPKRPFFAYIAYNCPHAPYEVPDELAAVYRPLDLRPGAFPKVGQKFPAGPVEDIARAYAMIENIDTNFGRLLAHLQETKQLDNTCIIFLTDNGPGGPRFNGGLRAAKGTVYEGSIRVPCFVRLPGGGEPRRVDLPAAHIDWAPTLTALCGLDPMGKPFDGVNLLPWLRGDKTEGLPRSLFTQWHRGDVPERDRAFSVRGPHYKLVQSQGVAEGRPWTAKYELFDLHADPYEQNDLAAQKPDIVKQMQADYHAWFAAMKAEREFAQPRITIGHAGDNPSSLTPQDWRGSQGWGPNDVGHWDVRAEQAGTYALKMTFPKARAGEQLTVEFAGRKTTLDLAEGATEARVEFSDVPSGDTPLSPRLTLMGKTRGVRAVEVKWSK